MTAKEANASLQLNLNVIVQALVIAAVLGMCGFIWDSTSDNAVAIADLRSQIRVIEARNEALVEVPARLRAIENKLAGMETKLDTLQRQKDDDQ